MNRLPVYILLLFLPLSLAAQDRLSTGPVDTTSYPDLSMPVQVIRSGQVVTVADSSSLLLREDGIPLPVKISCPPYLTLPVALSVGIERSLDNNFPAAISAAHSFVERLRFLDHGDNMSLWEFATFIDQIVGMTSDSTRIQREIGDISVASWPFNGTPLYETMTRAVRDVAGQGVSAAKSVLFFTDGVNNTSYFNTSLNDVVREAVAADVRVFVIGIGNKADGIAAMRTLCETTGGFYISSTHTAANDSVHTAMQRYPPPDTYWCTVSFRSPFCPDGSTRTIDLTHASGTDSLRTSTNYTAPRRDSELRSLPLWVSPGTIDAGTGDTVYAALGISPETEITVDPFTIILEHPGLSGVELHAVDPAFSSWGVQSSPTPTGLAVSIAPPVGALLPPGQYTILIFRTITQDSLPHRFAMKLDSARPGCYAMVPAIPQRIFTVFADTVLADRGGSAEIDIRADRQYPEGLQNLSVDIRIPHAGFDTVIPVSAGSLPSAWHIESHNIQTSDQSQILTLNLKGSPLLDTALLARVRVTVSQTAPYRIPVELEIRLVNSFGSEGQIRTRPGLLVIRDSCHNNIVSQTGMLVAAGAPNPFRNSTSFQLVLMDPQHVAVDLFSGTGTFLLRLTVGDFPQGTSSIRLEGSELTPGAYYVRFSGRDEIRIVKVVRVR